MYLFQQNIQTVRGQKHELIFAYIYVHILLTVRGLVLSGKKTICPWLMTAKFVTVIIAAATRAAMEIPGVDI